MFLPKRCLARRKKPLSCYSIEEKQAIEHIQLLIIITTSGELNNGSREICMRQVWFKEN